MLLAPTGVSTLVPSRGWTVVLPAPPGSATAPANRRRRPASPPVELDVVVGADPVDRGAVGAGGGSRSPGMIRARTAILAARVGVDPEVHVVIGPVVYDALQRDRQIRRRWKRRLDVRPHRRPAVCLD